MKRRGFSLVELFVVLAIIMILIALLLPAIQMVRESGNKVTCQNRLHQMAIALHNYEHSQGGLPQLAVIRRLPNNTVETNYLGPHARLLPYMEKDSVFAAIDGNALYGDPKNTQAVGRVLKDYICPSEAEPEPVNHSYFGRISGTNYVFCTGDWYVWLGQNDSPWPRGAFGVNLRRRWADFRDGTSNTLLLSEVKNRQPTLRDCGPFSLINHPANVPPPDADPLAVCPEYAGGGCVMFRNAHTQWAEMSVHHNGFTTAWPPNKKTPGGPGFIEPDVNIISVRERNGGPTFAAITARSYHPGGVFAAFGDGSVRFVRSTINPHTWRALGSVSGGEVVADGDY